MRRLFIGILIAALLSALTSCTPNPLETYSDIRIVQSGYLHKGGAYKGDVILHDASIAPGKDGDDYVVTLKFTDADSSELREAPEYCVYMLENPSRLVIRCDIVAIDTDELAVTGGAACFAVNIGGYYSVYIQLSDRIVFSASESGDEIRLGIGGISLQDQGKYYPCVLAETADSREAASLAGMTPALAGGDIVFISPDGYEAERDAQASADSLKNGGIQSESVFVLRSGRDVFGESGYNSGSEKIKNASLYLNADGNPSSGEFWVYNAQYLAPYRGRTRLFVQKDEDGENTYLAYSYDGTSTLLGIKNTGDIVKAQTDADERYAGILMADGFILYDILSDAALTLDAANALGKMLDFDWGEDNKLYFTALSDETGVGVYSLDVAQYLKGNASPAERDQETVPAGTIRTGGGRVYLSCLDGAIYYSQYSDEQNVRLVTGGEFLLSPSGKHIAVLYQDAGEDDLRGLILLSVETGGVSPVCDSGKIAAYCFSMNDLLLHYLIKDGENEDFPYALYTYRIDDDETFFHGRLRTDVIIALPEGNLAMTAPVDDGGEYRSATYMLRLNYID